MSEEIELQKDSLSCQGHTATETFGGPGRGIVSQRKDREMGTECWHSGTRTATDPKLLHLVALCRMDTKEQTKVALQVPRWAVVPLSKSLFPTL